MGEVTVFYRGIVAPPADVDKEMARIRETGVPGDEAGVGRDRPSPTSSPHGAPPFGRHATVPRLYPSKTAPVRVPIVVTRPVAGHLARPAAWRAKRAYGSASAKEGAH
jgi:hypothetical protein